MAHNLFLIAPGAAQAREHAENLRTVLASAPVAVLLVPQGGASDADYCEWVRTLTPLAQANGCAVIVNNRPDLVRALGVDGVHMSNGIAALREAIADLKPEFIVGTGDIGSRHEAMVRGELDVDYLMFGDREGAESEGAEMANWWAETFEVPSVYFATGPDDPVLATIASEFVALAAPAWDNPQSLLALAGETA